MFLLTYLFTYLCDVITTSSAAMNI